MTSERRYGLYRYVSAIAAVGVILAATMIVATGVRAEGPSLLSGAVGTTTLADQGNIASATQYPMPQLVTSATPTIATTPAAVSTPLIVDPTLASGQTVSPTAKPASTPKPTAGPTPTPGPTPAPTPPPAPSGWVTVVNDQFNGGLPGHWHSYNGPYGSGPGNCAIPSHAYV